MAKGASMQWLLLGKSEMYESGQPSDSNNKVELPYFELKNGDLIDKGKMCFDPQFLDGMLEAEHLMLVEHEGQKLFIDTSARKAISGTYLVTIDEDYTFIELQKLPGEKVIISFNENSYKIDTSDIAIIGKLTK